MRRVFVAIDIPEEIRRRAAYYIEALRSAFRNTRVSWTRPEKLHLTLRFIGDVDDSQLEDLQRIVAQSMNAIPRFTLRIQSTGVFPSVRKPRVLWLGISDDTSRLPEISGRIDSELEKCGLTPDKKQNQPHVTIGRIKNTGAESERLARLHLNSKIEPVEFPVRELVIYESTLLPTGSVYSSISRHILKTS